jgi:hypothetical protein
MEFIADQVRLRAVPIEDAEPPVRALSLTPREPGASEYGPSCLADGGALVSELPLKTEPGPTIEHHADGEALSGVGAAAWLDGYTHCMGFVRTALMALKSENRSLKSTVYEQAEVIHAQRAALTKLRTDGLHLRAMVADLRAERGAREA